MKPVVRITPSVVIGGTLTGQALAEMLYRKEQEETCFLYRAGDSSVELQTVPGEKLEYRPLSPSNTLLTHSVVLFPDACEPFESEEQLFSDVQSFIHRYVDVSPEFEDLSTLYVLLSWVYDAFRELPYLRVIGDYGSGKTRFLTVLGSLCYVPIFASGASSISPLFRIMDLTRGTLVIDESDFRLSDEKAEIVKIFNNGNAKGFPVLRSEQKRSGEYTPTAFHVFGPKVIATRRRFQDRALESRCLTEEMGTRPLREDIPITLPPTFEDEARALRNQLLAYRFARRFQIKPGSGQSGLDPRISQITTPLFAVAPSEALRARIHSSATRQSSLSREGRSSVLKKAVRSAILSLVEDGISPISVQRIASAFNESRDLPPVSSRWMGHFLRSELHITPVRRHGVFVLSPECLEALSQSISSKA